MLVHTLQLIYSRDLKKLITEIAAYQQESNLWKTDQQISNSAGNLCLHLIGNLNAFIGAELGKTGYVRNRPLEFTEKDIPREVLIARIEETIIVVDTVLGRLTAAELAADFPLVVFEQKTSTQYMLVHLATHLAYHLGQINYHRRLLDI